MRAGVTFDLDNSGVAVKLAPEPVVVPQLAKLFVRRARTSLFPPCLLAVFGIVLLKMVDVFVDILGSIFA